MKKIFLIRHAKTHPARWMEDDFDRKLTDRGKEEARKMAVLLNENGFLPDILICSPARRTQKTANIFSTAFGMEDSKIKLVDSLYEADYEAYLTCLQTLGNDISAVAIIGHNPGITDFANHCCREILLDYMPTSSVFIFNADISCWTSLSPDNCRFISFYKKNKI